MSQNQVLIAVPSKEAKLHAALVQNLFPQVGENPFLIVAGVSPVAWARNQIVDALLASKATHVWMIDDDTIPPKDALSRMLGADKDIISGVTPILRQNSLHSNVWENDTPLSMEEIEKKEGLFTARGVGASCILIKREVFEKMDKPYFAEMWEKGTGRFMTEDTFFCAEATELGFDVSIDPTIICNHGRSVVI